MRNQLLRDADWAGMAHSVEIRVPLVDAMLLAKLADMGLGAGQRNLKHLLLDACNEPEAPSTIPRRKTGFLVPIAKWIETATVSYLRVEAHSLAAIAAMPLVATLGVFCGVRGLKRAVSSDRTGSVRRIWRNCRLQS